MTVGERGVARVAVIGSGPAGVYTAQALTDPAARTSVQVDVYDRLPVPYGLVRYGVAPDHPKIKSIIQQLRKVMERPAVRFLGNIRLGRDVTLAELRAYYDAVVVASGASADRALSVPGEDLPGSISATEFVSWYSGHPDSAVDGIVLTATRVAVIGAGNVALDVARMLLAPVERLRATDVPEHVLTELAASPVRDVYILARRGVAQAKFSSKELHEIGELPDVDVLMRPQDLHLDERTLNELNGDPARHHAVDVLRSFAQREPQGRTKRLHLEFMLRPDAVIGTDRVEAVDLERTAFDSSGTLTGTGEIQRLPVQLVVRSVGYRGLPTEGLPFDAAAGIIPHRHGAVLSDGRPVPGVYVAGWIKHGPNGLIGTNRKDASDTVATLFADLPTLPSAPHRDTDELLAVLRARGVDVVDWAGWQHIDAAEVVKGRPAGRSRVKIHDWSELLALGASSDVETAGVGRDLRGA
jgi:ferredoxin--NADP+ reductase